MKVDVDTLLHDAFQIDAAPAHEAIIDCLVRTIVRRRVPPPKTVSDHEYNPGDDLVVIHSRNPMRKRKVRFNPTHLGFRKPNQISHGDAFSVAIESDQKDVGNPFKEF